MLYRFVAFVSVLVPLKALLLGFNGLLSTLVTLFAVKLKRSLSCIKRSPSQAINPIFAPVLLIK